MGVGMGAVEKAVERSAQRSAGGNGNFLPGIFWKDDKSGAKEEYRKVVRFLSDDAITAGFYEFVKGGEIKEDGKQQGRDFIAPQTLVMEVEEEDQNGNIITTTVPIFEEVANEKDYFKENKIKLPNYTGEMKPAKISEKTVNLAVLREEYFETVDGRRRSLTRDKKILREWEDSEGKHSEEGLFFGVIKQGHKNFWSTLVGYYNRWGTICDRDYEIVRQGNNKDTTYIIIPMEVDPELDSPEKVRARYWETEEIDDPKNKGQKITVLKGGKSTDGKCPVTMKEWCIDKAKYENAKEWYESGQQGKPSTEAKSESRSEDKPSESETAAADERAERSQPVSEGKSAQSLREELEKFAK